MFYIFILAFDKPTFLFNFGRGVSENLGEKRLNQNPSPTLILRSITIIKVELPYHRMILQIVYF